MSAASYRLEPCRIALNRVRGMPFEWTLNPYMGCAHRCTFCYVRAFEARADRPADDRYGRSIRVKTNIAEVLDHELSRPRWAEIRRGPKPSIAIGAATDPYQPCEGRFRLTRACLQVLERHAQPFGIITRGPLVQRDIDLLRACAHRASVSVHISLPTLDPALWRATEPGTAPPAARLRAIRALADAGIRVGVAMAPLIPGLTDAPESIEQVVRAAREAGAYSLWTGMLYLRPGTREHFLGTLAIHWPAEAERLSALYASRAYLPREAEAPARAQLRELRERIPRRADAPEPLRPQPQAVAEPPRLAIQLGLAFAAEQPVRSA